MSQKGKRKKYPLSSVCHSESESQENTSKYFKNDQDSDSGKWTKSCKVIYILYNKIIF